MKLEEPKKSPPAVSIKSPQYDLFSQFVTNDQSTVSNTAELWESVPKYFFTPKQAQKLRTKDGLAKPYKWSYLFKDTPFTVKIQPALIEQKDENYQAFFPGETEELVEEALKKILTDQNCGMHDPKNVETWIRFSLSMIQRELKTRGRSRPLPKIKHAIKVMSKCIITLYRDGEEVWEGSILQDLVTVNREKYLSNTNAQHIARLPLFLSHAINQLEYRQFNYDRLMCCKEQLTRWLYKKLIHRYRQASFLNDYHINFSTIREESGFLQQDRAADNRKKVIKAIEELISRNVLFSYKTKEHRIGRKIVDVTYIVKPSQELVKEQKAANKRASDGIEKIKRAGIAVRQIPPPQDKACGENPENQKKW